MQRLLMTAAASVAMAGYLVAGGLGIDVGNPEANPEARAMKAVLTARVVGCAKPSDATLTATAVGIVNGERRTVPLKVTKLKMPGVYAVTRQWPQEGQWAVELVARAFDRETSTVVAGDKVKHFAGRPKLDEIAALLDK